MTIETIVDRVIRIIRAHLSEEYRIVLFGSWANENAQTTSDIDIGILGKQRVPWQIMVRILQEVDEIPTVRSIDVVDLQAKDDVFKNKVLQSAKVLS